MLYLHVISLAVDTVTGSQLGEWAKIVTQVGFPIVVAIFLLWYIDRRLERFRTSIDLGTKMISVMVLAFGAFPPIIRSQTEDIIRKLDENNK